MPTLLPTPARRSFWGGALVGVGVMAALDETVFHQLLGWHHFYDRATPLMGLISDGVLHAGELLAIVAGLFVLVDQRRAGVLAVRWLWAGVLLGLGAFQLFDGVVDHKLLRLHQVRYGVPLLPYDLLWNAAALALLLTGALLFRRAAGAPGRAP